MDSLDAQCLLVHTLDEHSDMTLPELWRHGPGGSLAYKFAGSPNDFSWDADAVSEMAATWLELGLPAPEPIRDAVHAHRRVLKLLDGDDRDRPDLIHHDLLRGEILATWLEDKVVLIVEEFEGAASRSVADAPV